MKYYISLEKVYTVIVFTAFIFRNKFNTKKYTRIKFLELYFENTSRKYICICINRIDYSKVA